jgi:hypothetical protein
MTLTATPQGGRAVMNRRLDPTDSLDFFPTPPWATRALFKHVLLDAHGSAWEPAAGAGHMAEVMRETFDQVHASDVFDYGAGYDVAHFAGRTDTPQSEAQCPFVPDWIWTNPPFNAAADFAIRGLHLARRGVALLVRSNWAEGKDRYRDLFRVSPPSIVAQFVERVPMVKGCWDPEASTATAYAWFIWDRARGGGTRYVWIPPGCRTRLEAADDRRRFAAWTFEAPASIDEELLARKMLEHGRQSPRQMMDALGIGPDRLTRFLRDIARADAKKKRSAMAEFAA